MLEPVFWSKLAQPSRPFVAGKPVGIDIGTLETITFQVALDRFRPFLSHSSCVRPSIVFGCCGSSTALLASRKLRVSRTKSSRFRPQRKER